ncbi:hypothetical protein ISN44_As12g038460 [Arabidopsis suecica]|uniref:Uncharacterized protein n=1 Tax=Arabidopsis suecica TaxID=45249 RepID=A0A8T1YSB8_ARASU|nr:hypothetical protein ISN44_As12g038460 [Arabidopsis suecica]KAG7548676.1 hypothetical protein ISN44_As12g038460 [Arabidopsis suecica]
MAMDDNSVFFKTDCASILSQIKDQDEQIRLKRRWLLGCDMSESKDHTPGKTEFVPESLLREDDVFYETIKSRVGEAFGFCKNEQVLCNDVQQKELKFCNLELVRKLDSLTNKGLYLIAMILTGGSTSFDKTRWKIKEIIRDSVSRDFGKNKDGIGKEDIINQLHQVLSDPDNFREDCRMNLGRTPTLHSHRDAALRVLNELDGLSTQTLRAMKRKLKGSRMIPQLKTSRFGQSRSDLINQVRQASEKMLSELSAGDKLQEQLAKALSVVDLSLKLSPGYKTAAATDFFRFSPETKNLQNEIVKAVWSLRKVRFRELKRLHLCLDPEAEVSNDSLRSAVRKMLIEYLFECSCMDTIPKSLMEALSLVNRRTRNVEHKVCPREAIDEETECILNVSAQVKQICCQCTPNYELDQDFGDAYMEELEDSDDNDDDDDDGGDCRLFDNEKFVNEESRCRNIKLEVKNSQGDAMESSDSDHEESGAECLVLDPTDSTHTTNQHDISSSVNKVVVRDLPESITRVHPRSLYVTPTSNKSTVISDRHDIGTSKTRVKVERDIEMEVDNQFSSRSLFSVENIKSDDHGEQKPQRRHKNQYLAVQEISDETSLVAHNLIGRLLEKFADRQGLNLETDERSYLRGESRLQEDVEVNGEKQASSQAKSDELIIVSVIKEQMPSLEESVLMRLKELMEVS